MDLIPEIQNNCEARKRRPGHAQQKRRWPACMHSEGHWIRNWLLSIVVIQKQSVEDVTADAAAVATGPEIDS